MPTWNFDGIPDSTASQEPTAPPAGMLPGLDRGVAGMTPETGTPESISANRTALLTSALRLAPSLVRNPLLSGPLAGAAEYGAEKIEGSPVSPMRIGISSLVPFAGWGLGQGASVVRRHFGQQAADEAAVGAKLGEMSPALKNEGTGPSMQAVLKGAQGPDALSQQFREGMGGAQKAVGEAVFPVPAFKSVFPGAPETMTLKDAMDYFTALGAGGFSSKTGAVRDGMRPMALRTARMEASQQIAQGLATISPEAAQMFLTAERSYGQGAEILRIFRTKGVLDPAVGGLNMGKLQAVVGERMKEIERRFGPEVARSFYDAVYRGGRAPAMDIPRGALPIRAYPGSLTSEAFRIPLPTKYTGSPLSIPTQPFTAGGLGLEDILARSGGVAGIPPSIAPPR